jgi:hypothetical protein
VKQLAAGDRQAIDAIVESPAFRDGVRFGFGCGQGPTDNFRNLYFIRPDGGQFVRDVSGCRVDSAAHALYAILEKY